MADGAAGRLVTGAADGVATGVAGATCRETVIRVDFDGRGRGFGADAGVSVGSLVVAVLAVPVDAMLVVEVAVGGSIARSDPLEPAQATTTAPKRINPTEPTSARTRMPRVI